MRDGLVTDQIFSKRFKEVVKNMYFLKNNKGLIEAFPELFNRVATFFSDGSSAKKSRYLKILSNKSFLPNYACMVNAGRNSGTLFPFFALRKPQSASEYFDAYTSVGRTLYSGAGVSVNLSDVKVISSEKDKLLHFTDAIPMDSYMELLNPVPYLVPQKGRYGTIAVQLDITHPSIYEFLNYTMHKGFSSLLTSVLVSDEFMEAVKNNEEVNLCDSEGSKNTVVARELFKLVCKSQIKRTLPSIYFKSRLVEQYDLDSVSPCGEFLLKEGEGIPHGAINLNQFIENKKIDYDRMHEVVDIGIELLEKYFEKSFYPEEYFKNVTQKTKRIGLGIMGLSDVFLQKDIIYGSKESIDLADEIFSNFSRFVNANSNNCFISLAPTGSRSALANSSISIEAHYWGESSSCFTEKELVDFHKKGRLKWGTEVGVENQVELVSTIQKYVKAPISKSLFIDSQSPEEYLYKILFSCWQKKIMGIAPFAFRMFEREE